MTTNQYTLFQFIQEEEKNAPQYLLPSSLIEKGVSNAIGSVPLANLLGSNKKVEEFKKELTSDLQSKETLNEISRIVGTPLDGESEDDFVNRSLGKLRVFLNQKYK
ncbi:MULTISPECIES: hypothetical protein [unclassified Acinetobacter]|jgi:hypothetical protein|uniref:Uncharacterized protein n=1 Tax=Acinetobacter sp. A1-4-2 TaxID=3156489 RepID=A0AAU7T0H6_9GAMM